MLGLGPPADRQARRAWWQRQIRRQQDAHVPVAEFCRRLGVRTATFYSWKQRLRTSAAEFGAARREPPRARSWARSTTADFVPVSIVEPEATTRLEIALGNACVVRLQGPVDPKLLRTAIRAAGQLDGPDRGAR